MENKNAKNNIKLGVFVTIGLVLFAAAIYFIGNRQHLFSKTITLNALFTDISGLQVGNNVRFSGINVGTIEEIEIASDSLVKVKMVLEKTTQKYIKKDARASIGSEGLMGNKVLNISPGSPSSKMIEENDLIMTKKLAGLDDIMLKMDSVAGNAVYITADLKGMLSNMHAGKGTLGKLFMDETMANNLGQTLVNVKSSSKNLDANLEALKSNIFFKKGIKKKEKAAAAAKAEREKNKK
ncbi:MAG TPA: MlaD family protein [Chitinophagales bacterium]|nr:MlaD family protein [Chitinophagales bacterium]